MAQQLSGLAVEEAVGDLRKVSMDNLIAQVGRKKPSIFVEFCSMGQDDRAVVPRSGAESSAREQNIRD